MAEFSSMKIHYKMKSQHFNLEQYERFSPFPEFGPLMALGAAQG
jgi:hypothetical protein